MTELPVLLASGVRRTPDLSGVEKCGLEKEIIETDRKIDYCDKLEIAFNRFRRKLE